MLKCCTKEWPLIRMHFHSYPHYNEVIDWLEKCDGLLAKRERFFVISTFDSHYQFEHRARKQQSFWFKSIKEELGKYCLGMARVTDDPVLIKKIKAPAMKKNIPFPCLIAEDLMQAERLAAQAFREVS